MKRLAALVILLCVFPIHAEDTVGAAIERLSKVDIFAFGGIGFAGEISKGEIDFRMVLSQPPQVALQMFEKLYATGNPQGKAYALFGIRKLSPGKFKEILVLASKSSEKVAGMSGCIMTNESLSDVAKRIDNGKLDLFFEYSSANTTKPRPQKP